MTVLKFELQRDASEPLPVSGFTPGHIELSGNEATVGTRSIGESRGLSMVVIDATRWIACVEKVATAKEVVFECVQHRWGLTLNREKVGLITIRCGDTVAARRMEWRSLLQSSLDAASALIRDGGADRQRIGSLDSAWKDLDDAMRRAELALRG